MSEEKKFKSLKLDRQESKKETSFKLPRGRSHGGTKKKSGRKDDTSYGTVKSPRKKYNTQFRYKNKFNKGTLLSMYSDLLDLCKGNGKYNFGPELKELDMNRDMKGAYGLLSIVARETILVSECSELLLTYTEEELDLLESVFCSLTDICSNEKQEEVFDYITEEDIHHFGTLIGSRKTVVSMAAFRLLDFISRLSIDRNASVLLVQYLENNSWVFDFALNCCNVGIYHGVRSTALNFLVHVLRLKQMEFSHTLIELDALGVAMLSHTTNERTASIVLQNLETVDKRIFYFSDKTLNKKENTILNTTIQYRIEYKGSEIHEFKETGLDSTNDSFIFNVLPSSNITPESIKHLSEDTLVSYLPILCFKLKEQLKVIKSKEDSGARRFYVENWLEIIKVLLSKVQHHNDSNSRLSGVLYFLENIKLGISTLPTSSCISLVYISPHMQRLKTLWRYLEENRENETIEIFGLSDLFDRSPVGEVIIETDRDMRYKTVRFETDSQHIRRFLYFHDIDTRTEVFMQSLYGILDDIWRHSEIPETVRPSLRQHSILPINETTAITSNGYFQKEEEISSNTVRENNPQYFKLLIGYYLGKYIFSIPCCEDEDIFLDSETVPTLFNSISYFDPDFRLRIPIDLRNYLNNQTITIGKAKSVFSIFPTYISTCGPYSKRTLLQVSSQ
eukprot:TRINITY_DN2648_c0_g1_i1.p1 TRINITY_DN2648_c0_g1~~TRINITY_DN2648_c0_g1_i1.p1  ORF type:complete len:688 (-),score=137.39 TRINITY_DN2648_c0_g1_i1:230-2257(-)